jgi:DNA invertase Pin-like site-specific DNA recombinase
MIKAERQVPIRSAESSIADLIHLNKLSGDRGIKFRSLTGGINTTTVGGKIVFHNMGALET